jgi:hypothetical protein
MAESPVENQVEKRTVFPANVKADCFPELPQLSPQAYTSLCIRLNFITTASIWYTG